MDVVLRNIDISLTTTDLVSLLQDQLGDGNAVIDIQRFKRTCGGTHKLLPLIRVTCASEEHSSFLLLNGVKVNGKHCPAEVPATPADAPAALGKVASCCDGEAMAIISTTCAKAVLYPADLPLHLVVEGGRAYVWPRKKGRFHRGHHTDLSARDLQLIETRAISAWPVMTANGSCVGVTSNSQERSPSVIVVTRETVDYHKATRVEVQPADMVLEVGCDLGECCAVASTCCGYERVVGVDLAPLSVSRARKAFPAIRFEVMDVLQAGAGEGLRNLQREIKGEFSKVLIDINGNRDLGAVCRVIQVVVQELTPAAIIVKSRALYDIILSQTKPSHDQDVARTSAMSGDPSVKRQRV
jgi:predicted O-methyltransferase YrrM